MAEPGTDTKAPAGGAPNLNVLTQYVKDFSFENPGAPQSLRGRTNQPEINIQIAVQSAPLSSTDFEVELRIDARAGEGQNVLFAIELVYAGVFRFTNVPPDQIRAVSLIECPRLLFPFARQVIADASRNGGFPPLMIDPVDFVAMFRQQIANETRPGAAAN